MIYIVIGLALLVPFVRFNQIGADARNLSIPPHLRPRIAHDEGAKAVYNVIWFLWLIVVFGLLVVGSGWWALLLFPGGIVAIGLIEAIVRRR